MDGYVNPTGGPNAVTGDRFVRRFFVVDVNSGQTSYGSTPQVIRVASSIQIWVQKDPSYSDYVCIPVVDVKYSERVTSTLNAADSSTISSPNVGFVILDVDSLAQSPNYHFCIVSSFISCHLQ